MTFLICKYFKKLTISWNYLKMPLRKKCPYSQLFWSVFSVSLRIQSKCGKMRTRITPNTDTFHAVLEEEFIKYVLTIKKELNIKITLESISIKRSNPDSLRVDTWCQLWQFFYSDVRWGKCFSFTLGEEIFRIELYEK